MNRREELNCWLVFLAVVIAILAPMVNAEVLYVDATNGNDANPGTNDKPVRTIAQAAAIVNGSKEPGPTTIKVRPGIYIIDEMVTFENQRTYTRDARLTIEATILPDDSTWMPVRMPIILSTVQGISSANEMHAPTLRTEVNHVTVRGLNFLGNPRPRTWHYAVHRAGKHLRDLVITQCLFLGGGEALRYSSPICANGDELIVDHCIFYDCDIPVIFWNAEDGISKGNAMRYCIVDRADIAAIWTCQTDVDFDFHHNIITRSQYFWMRASNNKKKYIVRDCIVTDNKYNSGFGTASTIYGQTGPEVTYDERNVIRKGTIQLEKTNLTPQALSVARSRGYLNVVPGTLGSDLGAGLFKQLKPTSRGNADERI
jgi:hypothetical protein